MLHSHISFHQAAFMPCGDQIDSAQQKPEHVFIKTVQTGVVNCLGVEHQVQY